MKRSLAFVSVVAACAPAFANEIPNPGFEVTGALGPLVLTNSGTGEAAAADGWTTFRPVASPITTELLESTDPLPGGGGKMMRLTTTSGFNGSTANGVFCNLLSPLNVGDSVGIDMLVEKGVAFTLGCVGQSGGFENVINGIGDGTWQRFDIAIATGPVGAFGIEINSGQGGTVFMDNALAVPTPGVAAIFAAAGVLGRRRRN